MRKLFTTLALAATALALAQIDPARTVVVVNGEEVKGAEYYRRMEFLGGVGKIFTSGFVEFPPGFMTIEQLITERLVLQMAKEKGVLPTDAEVEAEIKSTQDDNPKMMEEWTGAGRTREELVYQTRMNLSQFKLVTRGITVTDSEVERFYNENPTLFSMTKQVELKIIVVGTEEAQKQVDADLAAGKKFEDVVKQYSIDSITKSRGGDFGIQSWDNLSDVAKQKLEGVAAGKTTDWIVNATSRAKFLVAKVVPPKKRELNAALRKSIRREQMLAKGRVANNMQKEMADFRKRANIDIKEKSFADAYRKFIETYITGG